MKHILFVILNISLANFIFADTMINLDNSDYSCGKYKLSSKSTEKEIQSNCKILKIKTEQEQQIKKVKIKFQTSDGSHIKCKFINNKLTKCKLKD